MDQTDDRWGPDHGGTILPEVVRGSPRPLDIVRAAMRTYREEFWRVAGAAFVVFGIVAVADAIVVELIHDHHVGPVGAAIASTLSAAVGMAGVVFYAGILDKVVGAHLHGHPDLRGREILRALPIRRLLVADVLLALATIIGLALFVIPGVILFTLWSLVGPVITIEDRSVGSAFRRSWQLVRSSFWLTFLLVTLPLQVEQAALHAIHYAAVFEHPLLPALVLNGLLGATIASFVGLIEVVLAYELIMLDQQHTAHVEVAEVNPMPHGRKSGQAAR